MALLLPAPARAAVVATYQFNNTFAANEVGAPPIVPVDPTLSSAFVFNVGLGQVVYQFNGNNFPPAQQGGLTLDTTTLLSGPRIYSVEIKFQFFDRDNAWRRIADVENRQSDNGFYVDPSNTLDLFPATGSPNGFTNNAFHDVILTDDPTANGGLGQINAYLDGSLQINNLQSHLMDFGKADNPGNLLGFFLDNVIGGGQGEWSSGQVALIQLSDTVITPNSSVPEPATFGIWAIMLGMLGIVRVRSRFQSTK
jgi:hypothetical protein